MRTLLQNNFNGLQHIGLPVTDLERSTAFYRRLGFEPAMERRITPAEGPVSAVMMRRGVLVIELYQLPAAQLDAIRRRGDGHIDHIAFDVDDVEGAFAELQAAGMTPLEEAPIHLDFWRNGCRYFAIRGPDGEKLEFNQIL